MTIEVEAGNVYRSPLRYPGGKTRAIKTLMNYIPPEVNSVCSPFIGGGSFELALTKKGINVYGYDLFSPLITFWKHLLSNPIELAQEIEPFLGNVDKELFKEFQKEISLRNKDDISHAARFFIVNRCSFSGSTLSGGFSQSCSTDRFNERSVSRVREFRNDSISVNLRDAFSVIPESKEDMLFLDPPYFLSDSFLYGRNGNAHRGFDHELLSRIIHESEKPCLITYNDSSEIRDLYSDFNIVETGWSYGMNKSKKSSELIIHNLS